MSFYEVTKKAEGADYLITRSCAFSCGKVTEGLVAPQDLWDYEHQIGRKRFAQDAFPYLSADQREALFISGVCGPCYDGM